MRKSNLRQWLASSAAAGALSLAAGAHAQAEQATFIFDQPSMPMAAALQSIGRETGVNILVDSSLVRDVRSRELKGELSADQALLALLDGTGLTVRKTDQNSVMIVRASQDPQGGRAAGGASTVEALIVTAQKREEDIQDVPIAMSAFSQEDLTRSQIAGGPDLMTQVPNLTFTKTNFTSFSIQIRGIGTQAISATVDPAVAVAFNNTPFITNRFFEQEFYDLQRVEVLRGPQGTLYGRNATAGVVNIISEKPRFFYESKLSADVANYSSHRLEGMVNIPLVEDRIAFRLAGAWTKRDGFVTNALQGEPTDGRDLWSARASLRITPNDRLDVNLIYEHFEEDDDRLRSGKQLCTRHDFPEVLQPAIDRSSTQGGAFGILSVLSQGCQMGSLYDDEAFQVPNGFALPFYGPLANLGLPIDSDLDPYLSTVQSRDLRVIETHIDPVYQANSDILHLSFEYDLTDSLTLNSETAYGVDEVFSFNDYNRFNTTPGIFVPNPAISDAGDGVLDEDGVFCDPQLGCSSRLVAADVSTARSDQFSQEFRISSNFDGPFNFHLGANYLQYDTTNKYYVFVNTLSLFGADWCADVSPANPWDPSDTDEVCIRHLSVSDPHDPTTSPDFSGIYLDRNPINSLNDYGRNYFLSKNPFRLVSYAVFGEAQYQLSPDLKITAGLRYTVDDKEAPDIPTWLLVSQSYGLPTRSVVSQVWKEPTGRLVVDWKPQLGFTDETMVFASYAHGYKAGGANPPLPGALPLGLQGATTDFIRATQPQTFGPEFVDAFEVGTKNTLLDGRMTFNLGAFYYDYEGYQISQIANRSAINWNVDTEVWGAELEVDWRPLENLRLGFRGGYEKTKVGEGQSLIDTIDRTAGDPAWFVRKPHPAIPSNCIMPVDLFLDFWTAQGGRGYDCTIYYSPDIDPVTQLPYVEDPTVRLGPGGVGTQPLSSQYDGYPGFHPGSAPGGGAGKPKDIGGNELPNAPDFTTTFTIDYTIPLQGDWLVTLHGDFYRQSEAWTRIFNEDPYDKLKPFTQMNLAAIFTNDDAGWTIMAYVKNALDRDNITGAFLNSDDSGLTTNVFLNEPRLYGLRVTKQWTDGLFGSWRPATAGREGPFAFEVSGGISRLTIDAPNETFVPFWAEDWEPATFPLPLWVQNDDLDAGDERDVRLTYRPQGGPWAVSAAARFGRTNGGTLVAQTDTDLPIIATFPQYFLDLFAQYGIEQDQKYEQANYPDFVSVRADNREEYTLADFSVGRDVGMGSLARSQLALGLRYASFKSRTDVEMDGQPNRVDPAYLFPPDNYSTALDITEADFSARREFEGVGPMLSWEAAARLFGGAGTGDVLLDWSLEGGVLFGRQEAQIDYEAASRFYEWCSWDSSCLASFGPGRRSPQSEEVPDPVSLSRSNDVEVPFAGATLGLSYKLERVKVSAGYRYETFFDVIDGGVDESRSVDRTIHGPYLRFTVGFGG